LGIKPQHLAADSAYGSAANLAWLVKERQIEPHIPVFDKSNRTDGTFSRSDFVFDAERNHYTCPQGKLLVQFRRTHATRREPIFREGMLGSSGAAFSAFCSCRARPAFSPGMTIVQTVGRLTGRAPSLFRRRTIYI
jgi:hypothetical protein